MGTENKGGDAFYIQNEDGTYTKLDAGWPALEDVSSIFIDNDAAFEEQARAVRAGACEELTCDTVLRDCGVADTQGGRTYGDPELQAYEDWLDRMEPYMKHGADCDATGYETINLGSSLLTQPIEYRNENPATLTIPLPAFRLPKRGRCGSRKRYVKLMMSLGVPRNFANRATEIMRKNHISYRQNWEEYYAICEMFQFRPTGIRGRGIYDRENDQYELFPADSD